MARPRVLIVLAAMAAGVFVLWMTLPKGRPPEPQMTATSSVANLASQTRTHPRSSQTGGQSSAAGPVIPPIPASPIPPEVQTQTTLQFKAMQMNTLRGLYADYFSAHKVPPAQQDQVLQVLVDAEFQLFAQTTGFGAGGVPAAPPSREWLDQHHAEVEQKLQGVLGAENYGELRSYQRSIPDRILVQALNQELGGDALTPDLNTQLVKIFQEERQQVLEKRGAQALEGMSREQVRAAVSADLEQINQGAMRRAAAVLTPAQMEALARVQEKFFKPK